MEWTCLFCNRAQIVTESNSDVRTARFDIGNSKYPFAGYRMIAIRCVNPSCNEIDLTAVFGKTQIVNRDWDISEAIQTWSLRPESNSKPQPDHIPQVLRDDYFEACLIRTKSPKAAATLARRCLQGMIRDFCGISKARLIDEIRELRRLADAGTAPRGVELETIDAIDAVREIGNIGAHMERDIGVIIDVDEGEAQTLIELIELLFAEWYVARQNRLERLAKVKAIAAEKDALKRGGES